MFCPDCRHEQPDHSKFCSECGAALASATTAAGQTQKKKKMSGCVIALIVTAAVGVVAVPIVGIIAAIAIPNFLNAIDRGKQKRTMADLRSVGTAIDSFAHDHDAYPTAADIETLRELLEPEYIRAMPTTDGWNHPLSVEADPTGYRLSSPGKDGVPDGCPGGATRMFDADVCYADGRFTQWPDGMQQ